MKYRINIYYPKNSRIACLFFIILFCFSQVNAQNSNGESLSSVSENLQLKVLYEFSQLTEMRRENIVHIDTMELLVGQNHSIYKDWKKSQKDSLLFQTRKIIDSRRKMVNHYATYDNFVASVSEFGNVGFWSKYWETGDLYKDRLNNKITVIDEIEGVGVVKSEDIVSQNWLLLSDTLYIEGYTCRKATTDFRGRTYTVWFTLDIPINDGPWKFYGLPGLILKVEDDDRIFKIRLIGLEKVGSDYTFLYDESKNYTEITPQQYSKLKHNLLKKTALFNMQGSTLNLYREDNPIAYSTLEIEFDN